MLTATPDVLYLVLFKSPPVPQAPISAPAPVNSKDAVVSDGVLPAKHKPAVFVPAPPKFAVEVGMFPVSVHDVPFHVSVFTVSAVPVYPPQAKAFVLLLPIVCAPYPAVVFKSATSVQLEPFQDSLRALYPPGLLPPNARADVVVPAPPLKLPRPVFKSATSVQEVPFQVSTTALSAAPPIAI